jgi:hypothetical protein
MAYATVELGTANLVSQAVSWAPPTVRRRPDAVPHGSLMMRVVLGLIVLFVVIEAGGVANGVPAFAIQTQDGSLRQYKPEATEKTISDNEVDATIAQVNDDEWELTISVKQSPVIAVWFPWEPDRQTDTPRADATLVYYPTLFGVVERASSLVEWGWKGLDYPGACFAPLVVVADDAKARMAAAANWPPRRVSPMYSLGRIGLRYEDRLAAGTRRQFRALVVQVDRSSDELSWQVAVDHYKRWLTEHLEASSIEPDYPPWLRRAHGWLAVQLQNIRDWNPGMVEEEWERWKKDLPWIQFWGQMSDYFDKDQPNAVGRVGCCLEKPDIHPRYEPGLSRLARHIAQEGHVGFYARPRVPFGDLVDAEDGSETAEFEFLRRWLERSRSISGANAYYIDILGHRYLGDPLRLARLLKTRIDPATVVEYPIDIYPVAFLVSGSLGGGSWQGGPGRSPAELDRSFMRTTFPRFGRYLLADRIVFLGECNADGRWWGPAADYWTERQAFLLGAKFDVIHPTEDGRPDGPEDRALALAIKARDGAHWWEREPVYLDQRGLGAMPMGVDVRRFRGRDGEDLLVVDNWHARRGVTVTLDGRPVDLPNDALSILVVRGAS